MFGFGFEGRVKVILGKEFGYQPHTMYRGIVRQLSEQARQGGLNEYDAAIRIMLQMMYSVADSPSPSEKSVEFVTRHADTVLRVRPRAIAQVEILDLLDHVLNRMNGGSKYPSREVQDTIGHGYVNYEDWFEAFVAECGNLFPSLKPGSDGVSILYLIRDFIDEGSCLNAFNEGKHPRELAERLGPALSYPFENNK